MAAMWGPVLALASGIPLVLLGALLLWLRPRRAGQVFFGLFAVLWGTQVVSANLGLVVDSATVYRTAFLVALGVTPPAYLFLAQFAATTHGGRWTVLLPAVTGAVAAVAGLVLLTRPGLVLERVGATADGGLGSVRLGPAVDPLFILPFFGTLYVALGVLYLRYRSSPPGSPRHRHRQGVLALALFTSYQAVTSLVSAFGLRARPETGLSGLLSQFTALAGTALVVGLIAHLFLRPPEPEGRDPGLLAAFVVPAVVALATELFNPVWPEGRSWGLWRILTVAVLVHAIARYQLFDLDLRLKRWAGPAGAALALGLTAAVVLVLALEQRSLAATGVALSGTVATAMAWSARTRIGEAFFPGVDPGEDYLRARRRDVYGAALDRLAQAGDPRDEAMLAQLRESLGIDEREHQALLATRRPVPTEAPVQVAPGATVLERYRVDRLLGEGAHGRAHLAHDVVEDRPVVLKVVGTAALGGRAAALLEREGRVLASMEHPHIIGVHGVHPGPREVLLVLAYADGGSLEGLLERRGRLGLDEAAALVGQVLEGLAAAHEAGIVHRDVKPANVLLTRDHQVKLADFGVARDGAAGGTVLTAGPVGTLLYASPEQLRGVAVDHRSDLYSTGVLFHRLLTGRFPFRVAGLDDFQLRRQVLEEPPELRVDQHPPWVREVLERSLAKDPEERFQSAQAMRAALLAADGAYARQAPLARM